MTLFITILFVLALLVLVAGGLLASDPCLNIPEAPRTFPGRPGDFARPAPGNDFGRTAPTVAGLQEGPGCKTSGVADSALNISNGKPCDREAAEDDLWWREWFDSLSGTHSKDPK